MNRIFEALDHKKVSLEQANEAARQYFKYALDTLSSALDINFKLDRCRIREQLYSIEQIKNIWLLEITFHDEEYAQYKKMQMDYQGGWREDPLEYNDISFVCYSTVLDDDFQPGSDEIAWLHRQRDTDNFKKDLITLRLGKMFFGFYKEWADRNGWRQTKKLIKEAKEKLYKEALDNIIRSGPQIFIPNETDNYTVEINQDAVNDIWQKQQQLQENLVGGLQFGKDYYVNNTGKVILNVDGMEIELDQ